MNKVGEYALKEESQDLQILQDLGTFIALLEDARFNLNALDSELVFKMGDSAFRTGIIPYNGLAQRISCLAMPGDSGFTLICYADHLHALLRPSTLLELLNRTENAFLRCLLNFKCIMRMPAANDL